MQTQQGFQEIEALFFLPKKGLFWSVFRVGPALLFSTISGKNQRTYLLYQLNLQWNIA